MYGRKRRISFAIGVVVALVCIITGYLLISKLLENTVYVDPNQNYEYLMNLMRPERAKGCKIPSQVPVPSCSFQMHNCVTIKTNSSGNCAFLFNPFFS